MFSSCGTRSCTLYHNTEVMIGHFPPSAYAESPERIIAIESMLKGIPYEEIEKLYRKTRSGLVTLHREIPVMHDSLWARCDSVHVTADESSFRAIEATYGKKMLQYIQDSIPESGTDIDSADPDLYWSTGSMTAATTAVAAALRATQDVLDGKTETAFAIVRPPGHHCYDMPAGFCVFNNVLIAAKLAIDAGKRVAIVDWDYHFGDGTARALLGEESSMFVSLHCQKTRDGLTTYPRNTADDLKGDGLAVRTNGRCFNVQWNMDDANNAAYCDAFSTLIVPAIKKFGADIVFVSAGYDAVRGDDLAGMELSTGAFGYMASALAAIGKPVVAVLEGGYNPRLLAESVCETVLGLRGEEPYNRPCWLTIPLFKEHKEVIERVKEVLDAADRL